MNKFLSIILSIAMVACIGLGACVEQVADTDAPSMVEALLVTEVMDWGETLTAIRIEYSEEIACDAYDFTAMAFTIKSTRHIVYTYVNNSEEGITIGVEDNGLGFTDRQRSEILDTIRKEGIYDDERRSIGLSNVYNRLTIAFPGMVEPYIQSIPRQSTRVEFLLRIKALGTGGGKG